MCTMQDSDTCGTHGGDHDHKCPSGCYAVQFCRYVSTLPRIVMPAPTALKETSKIESAGSSQTSVHIYHITRCHIPDYSNLV